MKTILMTGLIGLITTGVVTLPTAAATETPVLESGYISFPPFAYQDEGRPKGYLVELTDRVLSEMGQPVNLVQLPAPRLYRQIESGETTLALASDGLHSLNETAVKASEPVTTLTLAVYRRTETAPINNPEDLKNQQLILLRGYSYGELGDFLEKHEDQITITKARTHQSALQMIQYGRADYLLNYQEAADATIAQHGLSDFARDVIAEVDVHLYVSRTLDNAQTLADQWDKHLRALKRDDQLPSMDQFHLNEGS